MKAKTSVAVLILLALVGVYFYGSDTKLSAVKQHAIQAVIKSAGADFSARPEMQASFDPDRDERAREELGYVFATRAYLMGVTGLRLEEFRYGVNRMFALGETFGLDRLSPVGEDGLTFNEFSYLKKLPNAQMKSGGSPNFDTLYGGVFYKVDKQPLVLTVPNTKGRFFNMQIIDAYMSNNGYIDATKDCNPCNYLVVGPRWQGKVPQGFTKVPVHHNEGFLAVRIRIDSIEEEPIVNSLQSKFDAKPLDQYLNDDNSQSREAIIEPQGADGFNIFKRIVNIAQRNPPYSLADKAAWEDFKHIGMHLNKPFEPSTIDPAIKRGMLRAIDTVHDIVAWKAKYRGINTRHNWRVDMKGGAFGQDYLRRAEGVIQGLFLHDPEVAMYFLNYHDGDGKLLNGSNNYQLHFSKDQLPPVKQFWSITLYDETYNLSENNANIYAVSDHISNLKFAEDGSLTIYLQNKEPTEGKNNWLPTPKGTNYRLTFRMYEPKPIMHNQSTMENFLPPIIKQ